MKLLKPNVAEHLHRFFLGLGGLTSWQLPLGPRGLPGGAHVKD